MKKKLYINTIFGIDDALFLGTVGLGLGAGSSIFGSLTANNNAQSDRAFAASEAEKNRDFALTQQQIYNAMQQKLQDDENAFNWSMQERMNQYNSPYEQRKRLEAAGFNPLFADPNGGTQLSPVVSASLPRQSGVDALTAAGTMTSGESGLLSALTAQRQVKAAYDNMMSDSALKMAQTRNIESQTDQSKALLSRILRQYDDAHDMNGVMVSYYGEKINESRSTVKMLDSQTSQIAAQTKLLNDEFEHANLKWNELISRSNLQNEQISFTKEQKAFLHKQLDWYDKEATARLKETFSRIGLNHAQSSLALENIRYIGRQIEYQVLENGVKALEFNIYNKTHEAIATVTLQEGKEAALRLQTLNDKGELLADLKTIQAVMQGFADLNPMGIIIKSLGLSGGDVMKAARTIK